MCQNLKNLKKVVGKLQYIVGNIHKFKLLEQNIK